MRNIEIMLSDGAIGNKAILLALSTLTSGNLNSKMKQGSPPITMAKVLPSTHDYIIPPIDDEEARAQANNQLLSFMLMAPNSPLRERAFNV